MVYDTARRLGVFLKLEPEKIYQHAGTRKGARAIGFTRKRNVLEKDELPEAFQKLTPGVNNGQKT